MERYAGAGVNAVSPQSKKVLGSNLGPFRVAYRQVPYTTGL